MSSQYETNAAKIPSLGERETLCTSLLKVPTEEGPTRVHMWDPMNLLGLPMEQWEQGQDSHTGREDSRTGRVRTVTLEGQNPAGMMVSIHTNRKPFPQLSPLIPLPRPGGHRQLWQNCIQLFGRSCRILRCGFQDSSQILLSQGR